MGFLPSVAVGDFSKVMHKHLTIVSASNGYDCFPSAINLLTNKTVTVMPLIGKVIAFENLAEEFQSLNSTDLKYRSVIINL